MSDNLVFGNPFREMFALMQTQNYLDEILPELQNNYPPQNGSSDAQKELYDLTAMVQEFNSKPIEVKNRYFDYDKDFEKFIILSLDKVGIPKKDTFAIIKQMHDDITPFIVKLKYHYQRLRPFQLAYYYNIPLYPYYSETSMTPSYPSGHTIQAKVYCEVLGNMYPKYYKALQELSEDIAVSRLFLGIHYKSDLEFGKICADTILKNKEFKVKYKI